MVRVLHLRNILEIDRGNRRCRFLFQALGLGGWRRRLITATGFEAVAEESLADRVKLEFDKEGFQFLVVPGLDLEIVQLNRAWSFAVDGHEPLGEQRVFAMRFECLLQLAFESRRVGQEIFHAAILADQLDGGLFPDPGHAGDIVRGVAPKRHDVDNLLCALDAPALLNFGQAQDLDGVAHA